MLILKGVNKKPEFEEGLPPGSKIYMQKKSAYITADLFHRWLKYHFIAHKPQGKVVLILDGHSSHSSAVDMLETARDSNVILLCLPSHTTSALQPLDRAVFGPFKTFFNEETNRFMRTNSSKKINRCNSSRLISKAWVRAATPINAMSGFRGSGIYPLNPNAIPESEFAISDIANSDSGRIQQESAERVECEEDSPLVVQQNESAALQEAPIPAARRVQQSSWREPAQNAPAPQRETSPALGRVQQNEQQTVEATDHVQAPGSSETAHSSRSCDPVSDELNKEVDLNENPHFTPPRGTPSILDIPQDCLAKLDINIEKYIFDGTDPSLPSLMSLNETSQANHPMDQNVSTLNIETPSKFLQEASPVPKIPLTIPKRAKQAAEILNSDENIDKKKNKESNKTARYTSKKLLKKRRRHKANLVPVKWKVKRRN